MIRTVKQIYDSIVVEKNKHPVLKDKLTSTSKTAIWSNIWYVTAIILNKFEAIIFDRITNNSNIPNLFWWHRKIKSFQNGDSLIFDQEKMEMAYNTIDEDKQLIKFVSIQEQANINRTINVLCAKEKADLSPDILINSEIDALQIYVDYIKVIGTNIIIYSHLPDDLQYNITIDIDGDKAVIKPAIELAINNYLKELDFAGVFYKSKFVDVIQKIPGVTNNIYVNSIKYKKNSVNTYTTLITGSIKSFAGYFTVNSATINIV